MQYRTMKCNNCNKLIEHNKRYHGEQYGNPFKQCPHCNHWYIDPAYDEPALWTKTERFHWKFSAFFELIFISFFVWVFAMLISSYVTQNDAVSARFGLVVAIAFFIWQLFKTEFFSKNLNVILEESYERLQDEEYLNLLLNTNWGNPIDSYYNQRKNKS